MTRRPFDLCAALLFSVALLTVALSARAKEKSLPFLTPDSAFVGVEPPDWVLDGVSTVFLGTEDLEGIDEAAALGADILHAGGPSPYYPLRRDDPASGIPAEELARLKAGIARAKSHGMRVILGVSPYAPVEIVKQHPEWLLHGTDDPAIREKAKLDLTLPENIGLRGLPLNTPYGDYAIECLAEMMRDLGVDGFSFDGCYHMPINFSPFEREAYQTSTGRDLPKAIDLGAPEYKDYLLWADEQLESWYRRLGERLQQINPVAAICTWTANAGRYGHFLTIPRVMSARMNRLIHCPVQEWWLDEGNLGATVVPMFGAAYVRAVSGGRVGASEPYLMSRGNPYSTSSFPAHELTVRCLGAMTNGSFTPLAGMAGKAATHATLREIQIRKPWFRRLEQDPWAAVLVSEQTRQFYAHGHVMERFLAHALGIFRMGMEEHLPLTLITELELKPEILTKYRALILPNVACLSDAQADTIRAYVRGGGGLVATCETSICDELGNPRANFALRDLFGVSWLGRPKAPLPAPAADGAPIALNDSHWAQRPNIGDFRWGAGDILDNALIDDPALRALVPGAQASYKGPMALVSEPAAPMRRAMIYFPEGLRDAVSCAVIGEQGAGRVVYLAAGLDAANFSYSFPYHRAVLSRAVRWAAREPHDLTVSAPMCVQSTFWRQLDGKGGSRRIVHFFNGLNTTAGHGLQDVEVPLREEAVPIHGIELRLRGPAPKNVRVQPEDTEPQTRRDGDTTIISLPPLAVQSSVVIEE